MSPIGLAQFAIGEWEGERKREWKWELEGDGAYSKGEMERKRDNLASAGMTGFGRVARCTFANPNCLR